jgi:hypothetical protein
MLVNLAPAPSGSVNLGNGPVKIRNIGPGRVLLEAATSAAAVQGLTDENAWPREPGQEIELTVGSAYGALYAVGSPSNTGNTSLLVLNAGGQP